MRSCLWQWLVFFLISSYTGLNDGKPILSNLIHRVGQGFQRAVSSFRNTTPISSSDARKNIPISDEDSNNSKNETNSELKKLSDEEFVVELEKMANSDFEGTTGARKTLNDIQFNKSSGKSLSQAIDLAVKKVNSSQKKLKCVGGGIVFLPLLFVWFQQFFNLIPLLRRRRQMVADSMVSDTDTGATNTGLLSLSPLARLPRIRPRPRPVTESIDNTRVETQQLSTPTQIVEEFVDEFGVPMRRIVSTQPIASTTIRERMPIIQTPAVSVPNNPTRTVITETIREPIIREGRPATQPLETVTAMLSPTATESIDRGTVPPIVERISTAGRSPLLNPGPPVTTLTERVFPRGQTPLSTIRDTVSFPPRPPVSFRETTTTLQPPTRIGQPLGSPRDATITTRADTSVSPTNPPTSTFTQSSSFLRSSEPLRAQVEELPDVTQTSSIQAQPLVSSLPNSHFSQLVPAGIFQRNGETPQQVFFDRVDNTFKPVS